MHIVVLCGGLSPERDVSISSGHQIANALRNVGHDVQLLDLFFGNSLPCPSACVVEQAPDLDEVRRQRPGNNENLIGPGVFEQCRTADIVFIALHGEDGENGRLQAAFDLAEIRYTGTGYFGSTLAMNKGISRVLFQAAGINVANGFILNRSEQRSSAYNFPVVIKPASGGSSIATTIVRVHTELQPALNAVFAIDNEALVEDFIEGREFSVGVLGNKALPVIEICPTTEFFDYQAKYQGYTTETCPAETDAEIADEMQRLALLAHKTLHLDVYSRTDFMLSKQNEIFCLESNTLPGMTPMSLLPQEASEIGLDFTALCQEIINLSMKRYL